MSLKRTLSMDNFSNQLKRVYKGFGDMKNSVQAGANSRVGDLMTKYTFQLERILQEPETFRLFMTFLKVSQSEDELLFLSAVFAFEKIREEKSLRTSAVEIYKKFIQRDALQEINLSNAIRRPIEEYFSKYNPEEGPVDPRVFQTAKYTVILQLKDHSFPFFKQSRLFQEYIAKKPEAFLSRLCVQKDQLEVPETRPEYTLDPLLPPEIGDKDIAFILQCIERIYRDQDAGEVKDLCIAQDHKCSVSTRPIDLGYEETRNMALFKQVGMLNYRIRDVINAVFELSLSPNAKYESNNTTYQIRNHPRSNRGYSVCVTRKLVPITGSTQREFCTANSAVYDPHNNTYIIVSKSCTHASIPLNSKVKRSYMISGQVFEEIDNNKTKYTEILLVSNNGRWPIKKLMKASYKNRAIEFHRELREKLSKGCARPSRCSASSYSSGSLPNKKINGLWDTLIDFERVYLKKVLATGYCEWTDVNKCTKLLY
jgi:hypothetical protein